MKEDKEIEKILLNDENYEKFLHSKTEKEFQNILSQEQSNKTRELTNIKDVPKDLLFTKNAIYMVINKESKTCIKKVKAHKLSFYYILILFFYTSFCTFS